MDLQTLRQRTWGAVRVHLLDALDERGLIVGTRIEFPSPGACTLRSFELAGPGPGEVLVETLATVVSPGTERAIYLKAETTAVGYPFVPGYCHVGRVCEVGHGSALLPGEIVATSGPHASVALVPSGRALVLPMGVRPEHAALTQLGFVSLQGVRRAAIQPGDSVLVVGCGLVGQIAAQLARIAGGEVTLAATSTARLEVARACGFEHVLNTVSDRPRLEGLGAAVVIEASGHPQALLDAALGARPGARVVLLGSSRGTTRGVDLNAWQTKGLTLIGAHTHTVPSTDPSRHTRTWLRECQTFLGFLAQGRLQLEPLFTRRASPAEAPQVYSDLARPHDRSVAILFDWAREGPWRARIEKPSPMRALGGVGRSLLGRPRLGRPVTARPRQDGGVVRFGLIGCGEIAVESAAALRAAVNATITFASDMNLDAARSLAAATGAGFSDRVEELLGAPDVDAVLISTPHHLHAALALAAARAGKHILVEKPMATTVADCDRMIAAAAEAGVVLSVCYCQRFDPRVRRARELIDGGLLGKPLGSRIVFGQYRDRDYWTKGLTGRSTSDWRARRATAGGGVLIMNACHLLDYVSWLVGSEIREVQACTATFGRDVEVEVEDSVSMSYRYASGALGTLDATTSLVGPPVYEQVLRGEQGQLIVAPELRFWSERTVQGYEALRWHAVRSLPRAAERRQFLEAFADAVLDGTPPPVLPREARAVQAAIEAAYAAAARGNALL